MQKITNAHTIGCNAVSWCPAVDSGADPSVTQQRNDPVKRLATGGCDNLVKIWKEDGDRWIEETKLEAHSDWVQFNHNGNIQVIRRHTNLRTYILLLSYL